LDKSLLIYSIENAEQPIEIYRYKIGKSDVDHLAGSFNKLLPIYYSPGLK
jgi:hypothetical protein